ncbi:hypothetical protein P9112_000141 [Eukaryota sp. TZLM1-RC]
MKPTYEELASIVQQYKDTFGPLERLPKPLDPSKFSSLPLRKVAFKIAYLGTRYHGLQVQNKVDQTIQQVFTKALYTSGLIPSMDRDAVGWVCCGRTDAGVSATCQIVTVNVRSRLNTTHHSPPAKRRSVVELAYLPMLNSHLPSDIRVLAYSHVPETFSPRFDCKGRTYAYFLDTSDMNVDLMQEASSFLIGTHDFRNFCKRDSSLDHYNRTIISIQFEKMDKRFPTSPQFHMVVIKGNAFLHNQIRYMITVLSEIGKGYKPVSFIVDLLNVTKTVDKPSWLSPAPALPLVFMDAELDDIEWITEGRNHCLERYKRDLNNGIVESCIKELIFNKMNE